MEVLEAIAKRRSIRSYTPQPVSDEDVEKVIQAGLLAPSSNNQQPWAFVVVRDEGLRAKLAELVTEGHVILFHRGRAATLMDEETARERAGKVFASYGQVPVWIVAFRMPRDYFTEPFKSFQFTADRLSVAAALENMVLAARSLDLATCWTTTTAFLETEVKELLGAPPEAEFIALTPLGYPESWPDTPSARKPVEEVVFRDRF